MMNLIIGGKEYHIEFTIEASLYNECTEKVTTLLTSMQDASGKEAVKNFISSMADIPQTTLTMFYAGLLEHHGIDGDGTVASKKEAKKLIAQYLKEHKDDETGNFYGVMNLLIEQMAEDGFFELIGLSQIVNQTEEQKQKSAKTPQDHKRKTTNK